MTEEEYIQIIKANVRARPIQWSGKMIHKEATKTKACCNCVHCIRTGEVAHISCYCDIDNHYQGYLEVLGSRCELWEHETKWSKK